MHLVERRGFQFNTDLFWGLQISYRYPRRHDFQSATAKNNKHLGYSKFYEIIGFA